MNIIEDGSELIKWRSVDKSISERANSSPVYLNPGFEENHYEIKSKQLPTPSKQSPLEMLFETCKNIGHSLGLDEPIPTRKRSHQDNKDDESGVTKRKKQNISPVSHRSKSPVKIVPITEERKLLKPILNMSMRTTPDSSGSPRVSNENENLIDRQNHLLSSVLLDNTINNFYQNLLPHNASFHKNLQLESLSNYHGLLNSFSSAVHPIVDSHHVIPCDCFLCLVLSMKPLLGETTSYPLQSKINLIPPHNINNKQEMLFASLYNSSNERQSPMSIEYCMYCGLHCPSIQILLHHIHHNHLT